jgi:hypothetical protein
MLPFSAKRGSPTISYRQITFAERYTLALLRQQGPSAPRTTAPTA